MKAVVKSGTGVGLEYKDIPKPVPTSNEVLIEVKVASICGTDINYYNWNQSAKDFGESFDIKFPFVIGHEFSGTIIEVGSAVTTRFVGQRVAIETHIPCGKCFQCENGEAHNCANMSVYGTSCNGCFAPYAVADEKITFVLPDEVSFEEGALLEPSGVAIRAVEEAKIQPGDTLVINGCGPIGMFVVMIALVSGAGRIIAIDMDEYRLRMAEKMGAITLNFTKCNTVEEIQKLTKDRNGADVVIETSGSEKAYETIFDMIRLEGRIVTVGNPSGFVNINWTRNVNLKGASIKGIFGRRIWSTWHHLTSLITAKRVNLLDVVTHRFSFAEYEEAFQQIKVGAGKILFINDTKGNKDDG
ncbi:MAG: alcohol dehydrogenase catalytic domain-containing protein [Clostridiaceae bacterium]|nr:alcohol dehydrogenase catalytic domain-containing protein [Clostridiaceae bacterium]